MNSTLVETNVSSIFTVEEKLNSNIHIQGIATACENQCIRCNVSSTKLGRTK